MPSPEALEFCSLGDEAFSRGDYTEAVRAYQRALAASGALREASNNLGNALMMQGAFREALEAYLEAACPDAWVNASIAARALGDLDGARAHLERAIHAEPSHSLAHASLGNLHKDEGRIDLALASYRRALELDPGNAVTRANLAYLRTFDPSATPWEILGEARAWDRLHGPARGPLPSPEPSRRLRIGYVSPDFRYHCQAFFTLPLFASHDREAFEIFAYSSVRAPDGVTAYLKGLTDTWRDVAGLDDGALAEVIREDGIHILVDLTMHMANGRPGLFCRKPAPVQVAWLAYPGTTGLSAMDYRITDPYLDPPGQHDTWYSEASIRLPRTFWCYHALEEAGPDPGPLPVRERGHITFGCLNNACKVHPDVLELWERVLDAVPGSRLLLMAHEGQHRNGLLDRMRDPSRVDFTPFLPRRAYLERYRDIDICLDTFPYNGHTTSLDALWMGVPVVTRVGGTVVGRAGWSQLNNLGLPELAAWDDAAFVRIAAGLAGDLDRLDELRAGLRARMEASPLMDARGFARDLEAAYQGMAERAGLRAPAGTG